MKAPLHLWIIGLVSVVWHLGGAYDYTMTQMKNQNYLAMLGEPQRQLLDNAPIWFDAAWAVGVWFALLGSLLLLARSRLARPAFGFALIGLIGASVYSFWLASPNAHEITGMFAVWFTVAVAVVLVVLGRYTRAMTRRGILR